MKFIQFFLAIAIGGIIFSSCQKELDPGIGATATGTLKAASGDCMPVTIFGTYKKDTLLNFSNTVDVQVNINSVGSYLIKTDTINGYSFSANGFAGITGLSTIHLQATGRPILPETDVFTVKFDSSHCEINVIVTGAGGSGGGGGGGGGTPGTITATVSGAATTFNMSDTAILDNTTIPGYTVLDISGEVTASGETVDFGVAIPGSTVTAGTYDVAGTGINYLAYGDYNDGTTDFTAMTTGTNPLPTFTIVITSITATRVIGTFTGALYDSGTGPATKTITAGSFNVPRQ